MSLQTQAVSIPTDEHTLTSTITTTATSPSKTQGAALHGSTGVQTSTAIVAADSAPPAQQSPPNDSTTTTSYIQSTATYQGTHTTSTIARSENPALGATPSHASPESPGSHSSGTSANATTSEAPVSSQSNGYTIGSLAGGIVGAAIGAAILTFLATFLLCGRRRRQRNEGYGGRYEYEAQNRTPLNGEAISAEKPVSSSNIVGLGWQAYLPQSADDRTIHNAVKTLFDQVDLHVDNYYSRSNVDINDHVKTDLSIMTSDKLPAAIDQMMADPRSVLLTIKHCIASLLVQKITPNDSASRSLLPARLASAPHRLAQGSIPSAERQGRSHSVTTTYTTASGLMILFYSYAASL
jgi:hypothetical protein